MRSATKEERESVDRYIKSISHKTGIEFAAGDDDYEEDFDFIAEHPKADMSKVNTIRVNGKEYVSIDYVLEIIDQLETKEIRGTVDKEVGYQEAIDDFREAVKALVNDKTG